MTPTSSVCSILVMRTARSEADVVSMVSPGDTENPTRSVPSATKDANPASVSSSYGSRHRSRWSGSSFGA